MEDSGGFEADNYFEGQLTPISENDVDDKVDTPRIRVTEAAEKVSLLEESIKPRTDLPHLLVHLRERRPEKLHYIGVSFGLTLELFRFWKKHKFAPFYIGQIPNNVTGEHSCMVLKPLNNDEIEVDGSNQYGFYGPFYQDFRQRFAKLLASTFRDMEYKLAMSIIDPKINFTEQEPIKETTDSFLRSVKEHLSPHDMKRLEAYVDNLVDFHLILDLVPALSHLYFQEKIPVTLSHAQACVLLCTGLQNQNISHIEGQMKLERQQILSLFIKVMKKFYKYLYGLASKEIESTMPRLKEIVMEPHSVSVDEDLNDGAKQVEDDMKSKSESLFAPESLQRFAIEDGESSFDNALQNTGGKIPTGGLISMKSNRKIIKSEKENGSHKSDKKRRMDNSSHKSGKKEKRKRS
ncbi:UPF0202 plant-like protein [Trifolium pratense]|uniref:UPF0202 plant-like protein n=1 Tax=Trifolium pratense TaxID=57577 RepID=A0A2K3PJW7_TRIPR|nr:UPF0202 plant-like protein [Trifolium pratense]